MTRSKKTLEASSRPRPLHSAASPQAYGGAHRDGALLAGDAGGWRRACRRATVAVVVLAAAAAPLPARAYQLLREGGKFGAAKRAPYIAPSRLFQVDIGPEWQPVLDPKDPETVEFRMVSSQGSAIFRVHRRAVGEGARAKQLLLKAVDERLRKLPHFREEGRRDVMVNGIKAASVTGTFWYQGNVQYPRTVEEVFLVFGKDAFELHFECFTPLGGQLAPLLDSIYQSFQPRPSGDAPAAPADDDDAIETDDLPF